MKLRFISSFIAFSLITFPIFSQTTYTLNVEIDNLRNLNGIVQFALYNVNRTIPDKDLEKYFSLGIKKITDSKISYSFKKLPKGTYAVIVHHDENENGIIDKGFIYPEEGIGFSDIQSIGLSNNINFSNSSFELINDKTISIKVIYAYCNKCKK